MSLHTPSPPELLEELDDEELLELEESVQFIAKVQAFVFVALGSALVHLLAV